MVAHPRSSCLDGIHRAGVGSTGSGSGLGIHEDPRVTSTAPEDAANQTRCEGLDTQNQELGPCSIVTNVREWPKAALMGKNVVDDSSPSRGHVSSNAILQ